MSTNAIAEPVALATILQNKLVARELARVILSSPDEKPAVRAEAVKTFAKLSGKESLLLLSPLALDKNDPGAVREVDLDKRVTDWHPVRNSALNAVAELDPVQGIALAKKIFSDAEDREDMRVTSVEILRTQGVRDNEAALTAAFESEKSGRALRIAVAISLSDFTTATASATLERFLRNPKVPTETREEVAFQLAFLDRPTAKTLVRKLISDKTVTIGARSRIANALGREGTKEDVGLLEALLSEEPFSVDGKRPLSVADIKQIDDLKTSFQYYFFRFPEKVAEYEKKFPTPSRILNEAITGAVAKRIGLTKTGDLPVGEFDEEDRLAETMDACTSLCKVAEEYAQWGQAGFSDFPVQGKESQMVNEGNAAIRSLGTLFLIKATPFCPKLVAVTERIQNACLKGITDPKPAPPPKKEADSMEAFDDLLREHKDQFDPDTLARLKEFTDRVRGDTATNVPGNSHQVYAKQYYGLLLRELSRNPKLKESDQKALSAELESNEKSIKKDLEQFQDALSGVEGSLFNNYALASTIIGTGTDPDSAIGALHKMLAIAKDPLKIPYKWGSGADTEVGGSARAVPFHMALYLKGSASLARRTEARKNLISAVTGFVRSSRPLRRQTERDGAHLAVDGLAPYYFYPNLPFATSAVALLAKDPDLTDEEAATLKFLKKKLLGITFAKLMKSGVFAPMGITGYTNSPQYVNPFGGFALMAFIEECLEGGTKRKVTASLGILDPALAKPRLRVLDEKAKDGPPVVAEIVHPK